PSTEACYRLVLGTENRDPPSRYNLRWWWLADLRAATLYHHPGGCAKAGVDMQFKQKEIRHAT
ncbi:MAG: hypothetical protein WCL29_00330, partial [Pseudomonadota bacterium]